MSCFFLSFTKSKKKFFRKSNFSENNILIVKRKLLSLLGLPAYGIHCNIWQKHKDKFIIYFAKRSKKLSNFPGYSDNPVAGGQPVNISISENLKKEAYEEAGIKKIYLKNIKKGNVVSYFHNYKDNFISAIIFNYHLYKTNKIDFKNIDGEVDSFFLTP